MVWVDFQKTYDTVSLSWIPETLELVGTVRNIIQLLKRSMQSWRTVFFSGKNTQGKVKIRLFQGDFLSSLLIVVPLIPVTIILRTLKHEHSFGKGKEIESSVIHR